MQDTGAGAPVSCVRSEKYQTLVDSGMTELAAHFSVAQFLGHERPDVTDIYLASVRKGGRLGD